MKKCLVMFAEMPFQVCRALALPGIRTKLYVRRVLILDDCDVLMSKCLNFVKGAAASEDLPRDISRETLLLNRFFQENLLKKSLVTFAEFADQNAVFPKSMSSRFKFAEPLHYLHPHQAVRPPCLHAGRLR